MVGLLWQILLLQHFHPSFNASFSRCFLPIFTALPPTWLHVRRIIRLSRLDRRKFPDSQQFIVIFIDLSLDFTKKLWVVLSWVFLINYWTPPACWYFCRRCLDEIGSHGVLAYVLINDHLLASYLRWEGRLLKKNLLNKSIQLVHLMLSRISLLVILNIRIKN
jgi:hypothetical protein